MLNSLSLLPLNASELDSGMALCVTRLEAQGLSDDEAFLKISSLFEFWLDDGSRAAPLPAELRPLFAGASWAALLSKPAHSAYVDLIRKVEGKYAGSRREAVVILSHLPLMLLLGREYVNSPAKIAGVIGSNSFRSPVTWRTVQVILKYFKITGKLDEVAVSDLLARDKAESTDELRDADIATIVQTLCEKSATFGLPSEFGDSLCGLFSPKSGEPFIPYLQALLYVAVIDHFYDHPPRVHLHFLSQGQCG